MSSGGLLVIVPTRGRPERFAEFVDAWKETHSGEAHLIACLDEDDPTVIHYPPLTHSIGQYSIEDRDGFLPRLNSEAVELAETMRPRAIASFNDDHLPRTEGWDSAILQAIEDLGSGVVYPNDLLQRESLPTAPAISTDIVQALGWYAPPMLSHYYCDNFWMALGIGLERYRYLRDVIVEHMHPSAALDDDPDARKAPWDQTYEEANANVNQVNDRAAWLEYRKEAMWVDIARARAVLR